MDSKISRQKALDNAKISSLIKDIPPNSWTLGFNIALESAFDGAEVKHPTDPPPTILYHTLFGPPTYAIITNQTYTEVEHGFDRMTSIARYNNASSANDKKHYNTATLNAVESMSAGDSIYLLNGSSYGLQRKIFIGADNAWSCELSGDSYPGFVISPIDQTSFILAAKRGDTVNTSPEGTVIYKKYKQQPDGLFEVSIELLDRTLKIDGIDFARVFRSCRRLDYFTFDNGPYRLESKFIDMTDEENTRVELLFYPF